jgi:hypothetical protein
MSNVLQRLALTFDSTYTITLETKCFTFSKGSATKWFLFLFFLGNEHDIQIPL